MNINELPIDARALLYFHIGNVEQNFTGRVSDDTSIPYVNFRDRVLAQLSVNGVDLMQTTNKYGGMCHLFNHTTCLTAISKSIKGNSQRAVVRNLLFQFIDELEFDMHLNHDLVYNYKWNLVNQIIKDKLFG